MVHLWFILGSITVQLQFRYGSVVAYHLGHSWCSTGSNRGCYVVGQVGSYMVQLCVLVQCVWFSCGSASVNVGSVVSEWCCHDSLV